MISYYEFLDSNGATFLYGIVLGIALGCMKIDLDCGLPGRHKAEAYERVRNRNLERLFFKLGPAGRVRFMSSDVSSDRVRQPG